MQDGVRRFHDALDKAGIKTVLYESQKIKVRIGRLIESFERLTGARPGPKLQVHFRGIEGIEYVAWPDREPRLA